MPALYPENTQYGPPTPAYNPKAGPVKKTVPLKSSSSPAASVSQAISSYKSSPQAQQAPIDQIEQAKNISELVARLQQSVAEKAAGMGTVRQGPTSGGLSYLSKATAPSSDVLRNAAISFPLNEPIALPEEKSIPLPEGYATWGTDKSGRWVAPTSNARIVSMPESVGGGQYIVDPTQPGKLIKSDRGRDDAADIAMRAGTGFAAKDIEIDHIIPLWAGGADTVENRQLLRTDEHARKTKIQAVPLTLLSAGLISINEARVMTANAQQIEDNYDISKIPTPFLSTDKDTGEKVGMLPLDVAKKLADEWSKPPAVTFKSILKAIPEAKETVAKAIDTAIVKNLPAFITAPVWGLAKGFAREATMGLVPTTKSVYTGPDAATYGAISDISDKIGGVLGFIFGFGKVAAGFKVGMGGLKAFTKTATKPFVKSLATVGADAAAATESVARVGALAKLAEKPGTIGKLAAMVSRVPGAKAIDEATGLTAGIGEIGEDIATLGKVLGGAEVKSASVLAKEAAAATKTEASALAKLAAKKGYKLEQLPYAGGKIGVGVTDTTKKILYDHIFKNAVGQAAYGQLRATVPVLVGYEKDPGYEERKKQILTDLIYGGALGNARQTIGGYAKLGGTALVLGTAFGDSPEDALTSAVSMMALHGLGRIQGKGKEKGGLIDFPELQKDMDLIGDKVATKERANWLPEVYGESAKKGESISKEGLTPKRIAAENKIIEKKMTRLFAEGKWSEEYLHQKIKSNNLLGEHLLNGGQTEAIKTRKAIKSLQEAVEYMRKNEQGSSYSAPNDLVRAISNVPDEVLFAPAHAEPINPDSKLPNMKMQLTGVAADIDPLTSANQRRYSEAMDKGMASGEIFFVNKDSLEPIIRSANSTYTAKEIAEKKYKPSEKPWNNVQAWGVIKTPEGRELVSLGWAPREFAIAGKKNSQNNGIDRINAENPGMNVPKYDPSHNKDLLADTARSMDAGIVTATVTARGEGKKSGEPYMVVQVTDKNWKDAEAIKQHYKEGSTDAPLGDLLAKAKNNPKNEEYGPAIVNNLSENGYITPEVALKNSTIPDSLYKTAVIDTNNFFAKTLNSNDPDVVMAAINGKYGEIITKDQAQHLIDTKDVATVRDVANTLFLGIKNGGALPETNLLYRDAILPFFKSTDYKINNLSAYFADIPIRGKIKGAMTENIAPVINRRETDLANPHILRESTPEEYAAALAAEKGSQGTIMPDMAHLDPDVAKKLTAAIPEGDPLRRLLYVSGNSKLNSTLLRSSKHVDPIDTYDTIKENYTDPLTGLLNQKFAKETGIINEPMIFLDFDNFGGFNKDFSQLTGDKVLMGGGPLIEKYFPGRGYRLGGEEMGITIKGMSYEDALERMKALRNEAESREIIVTGEKNKGKVVGNITFTSGLGKNMEEASTAMKDQKAVQKGLDNIDEKVYNELNTRQVSNNQEPYDKSGNNEVGARIQPNGEPTENVGQTSTPITGGAPAGIQGPTPGEVRPGEVVRGATPEEVQPPVGEALTGDVLPKITKTKDQEIADRIAASLKVTKGTPNLPVKTGKTVGVTAEHPLTLRAESLYKDLYTTASDRINQIEADSRKEYLSKAKNILDSVNIRAENKIEGVSVPKEARISSTDYTSIKRNVLDNLRTRILNDLEVRFPIDQEISFSGGGNLPKDQIALNNERDMIRIENKRLLNVPLDEAEKELMSEVNKSKISTLHPWERGQLQITEKPENAPNINPLDRWKKLAGSSYAIKDVKGGEAILKRQLGKDWEKKWNEGEKAIYKKFGKGTGNPEKDVYLVNSRALRANMESNIKTLPKDSIGYGWSKAFNEMMSKSFGSNWQNDTSLKINDYFSTNTKKGQQLWDYLNRSINDNGYPLSQPKDSVVRLREKTAEKPYEQLTREEKKYIWGKRSKEAREMSDKSRLSTIDETQKEAIEQGLRTRGAEQGEDLNITDLTNLEMIQMGRIGAELGLIPTAYDGASDARSFFLKFLEEYNGGVQADKRFNPKNPRKKVYLPAKVMDKITADIRNDSEKSVGAKVPEVSSKATPGNKYKTLNEGLQAGRASRQGAVESAISGVMKKLGK